MSEEKWTPEAFEQFIKAFEIGYIDIDENGKTFLTEKGEKEWKLKDE